MNAKSPSRQVEQEARSREPEARIANFHWLVATGFWLLFSTAALAHPARLASAIAKIDRNGNVTVSLTIDLPAFVLNDTPQRVIDTDMFALLNAPTEQLSAQLADAKDRLLHESRLKNGAFESVTFPTAADVQQAKRGSDRPPLPIMMDAKLVGHLSPGARGFSILFPECFGSIVLTIDRPETEARALALEGGEWSPELPLATTMPTTSVANAPQPVEPSWIFVAGRYIRLGFEHILPRGTDHILFLLGLFLLSPRFSALLWQISAFTVAHSITLGLALYGVVRLPPSIVEPLIAASITFVAIENVMTTKLHAWRPIVVFCFGLIHGMGFAGVLMEMGLPRRDFATALVSFNVGVELGQLAVVAIAMLAVGWFRKRTWYRGAIVLPASCLIALIGLFWTIQRIV